MPDIRNEMVPWTSVLFYSIVICVRCFIGSDIEYPRELVLEGGAHKGAGGRE